MTTRGYVARPGGVLITPPPTNDSVPRPTDLSDLMTVAPPELPNPESSVEVYLAALAAYAHNNQALLAASLQELREQTQKGYVYPLNVSVTALTPDEYLFEPRLFTVSITNDGPGTIQYKIPYDGQAQWVGLVPTEVIVFNFIKPVIRSIGVRLLVAGAATAVRIVGAY